jgi:hypothetical protein
MISESSRYQFNGNYISAILENGKLLSLDIQSGGDWSALNSPKDAVKGLAKLEQEIAELRERIADLCGLTKNEGLINRALTPEPEPSLIYDDILALTSNHAREEAIKTFNATSSNEGLVLNVRGTERYGQPLSPDGPWHYRVSGFMTARQKKTPTPKEELVEAK